MVLAPAIPVLSQVSGLGNALGSLCRQVQRAQGAERQSQGLRRDGNSMGFPVKTPGKPGENGEN